MGGRPRTLPQFLLVACAAATPLGAQARLEGLVLTPLDEPVPGATVECEHDGRVIATTVADDHGAFAFANLPQQFVVARAFGPGPDAGAEEVDLLGEERGFARVHMAPARTVTGTVTDGDEPAAFVLVIAAASADAQLARASRSTVTDAKGRYALTHVPAGRVDVRAWRRGRTCAIGGIAGDEDATRDLAFERTPKDFPAAWVKLVLPSPPRSGAEAAQRFVAELHVTAWNTGIPVPLPPWLARPAPEPDRADMASYLSAWGTEDLLRATLSTPGAFVDRVEKAFTGDERAAITFAVQPGIPGRLVADGTTPIAGVDLVCQPLDSLPIGNDTRPVVRTLGDGSFTLPRVTRPVGDERRGPRTCYYAVRTVSKRTVLVGNASNPVWRLVEKDTPPEFAVRPAHAVALRVFDGSGAPVHGAMVDVAGADTLLGTGTSDRDGSARIDGLGLTAGTDFTCTVRSPAGVCVVAHTTSPGAVTDLGSLSLTRAAIVEVVVRSASGRPAVARAIELDGPRPFDAPRVLHTDRAGRVRFTDLAPGDYRVSDRSSERAVTATAGAIARVEL